MEVLVEIKCTHFTFPLEVKSVDVTPVPSRTVLGGTGVNGIRKGRLKFKQIPPFSFSHCSKFRACEDPRQGFAHLPENIKPAWTAIQCR